MNFITVVVCLMISRTHILLHFITVGYKKYRDTTWKSQKTFLNASFFYKTKRCHSSWYTSVTSFVPGGRSCSTSCYDTEPFAHKVYKKRDRGLGKRAVVLHGALSEWELKYRSFLLGKWRYWSCCCEFKLLEVFEDCISLFIVRLCAYSPV